MAPVHNIITSDLSAWTKLVASVLAHYTWVGLEHALELQHKLVFLANSSLSPVLSQHWFSTGLLKI